MLPARVPAIEDREVAAAVADELAPLQRGRGAGDAHTPDAEHVREEFVRDVELAGVGAIAGHQQPARQARFDEVKSRARGGLHELRQEHI